MPICEATRFTRNVLKPSIGSGLCCGCCRHLFHVQGILFAKLLLPAYWKYVFSCYTLKMPQTSTPFSRPNSIWSRFDNYPPAAPPAEILVSTSGFGPGGVSGPYRILMSLCKKPSCCGAGCSQGDNFCSAHTLLDEESD